jgi:hypothetical protein
VLFCLEENPSAPPCRFCANARVALIESSFEIGRPTHVGAMIVVTTASKDVDVAVHDSASVIGKWVSLLVSDAVQRVPRKGRLLDLFVCEVGSNADRAGQR